MNANTNRPKRSILLIEDHADSRLLVKKVLAAENYHVDAVANGASALDLISSGLRPDLILLDLSMPGMDGEEFLTKLRAQPGGDSIKVILMSGWDDLAARSKTLGAAGWIRKPIDIYGLIKEVGSHLA